MQTEDGLWIPDLFPKQLEVFNNKSRSLLVDGPRKSGKTWATLAKIVRHLWETPGARVAMFSKTLKNSKDGGTWMDLHRITLPEWIDAKIGLKYTTLTSEGIPGPKVDGQTRTPYFRVTNAHGGESELMLFSLDYDHDVEDKVKEQRFSMIYFSELSKFMDRKILSATMAQLRMPHLRFEDHQWISDTNPSEEGESSWIYQVWYVERNLSYEDYSERQKKLEQTVLPEKLFLQFRNGLGLVRIVPEENPYLDPRELDELKTNYGYDPGLYARYVEGKWVYGQGDSSRHFRAFFKKNVHVLGSIEAVQEQHWELLNPSPSCVELISGWDLGDVNHAAGLVEKQFVGNESHFFIVDELVSLDKDISHEEFTLEFMDMVADLEKDAGHSFNLDRAWSDRSSIEKYSASADTYPYLQVYASSKERIFLRGVPKPANSVRNRVQLYKLLLARNRIHISAHCTHVIHMSEYLKKGTDRLTYVVPNEDKHSFDWVTYLLLMECAEELEDLRDPVTGQRSSLAVQVR